MMTVNASQYHDSEKSEKAQSTSSQYGHLDSEQLWESTVNILFTAATHCGSFHELKILVVTVLYYIRSVVRHRP